MPSEQEKNIQKLIDEKVGHIKLYEKDIPAVITIYDIRNTLVVYISQNGLDFLNKPLEEIKEMGKEYFNNYFDPKDSMEYLPKFTNLMQQAKDNETLAFFQKVRPDVNSDWHWFSCSSKVLLRHDGSPILSIITSHRIDDNTLHGRRVENEIDEQAFLRINQVRLASLTERERIILRLMALGYSSVEIATMSHISKSTVNTHRRNIREKINAETSYDVVRFAQIFRII